jgi:hypothetical protein
MNLTRSPWRIYTCRGNGGGSRFGARCDLRLRGRPSPSRLLGKGSRCRLVARAEAGDESWGRHPEPESNRDLVVTGSDRERVAEPRPDLVKRERAIRVGKHLDQFVVDGPRASGFFRRRLPPCRTKWAAFHAADHPNHRRSSEEPIRSTVCHGQPPHLYRLSRQRATRRG